MPRRKTDNSALLAEYRKLAKRADQQLLRLERLVKEPGYQSVLKWGYKKAMRDIKSWSGEKATRFNTKPPTNRKQLQAKIADIKKFLGYSSATKTGIKKVFKKRQKTYKTKFGLSLKMEDMNDFFNSEEFLRAHEQLDGYTSSTYMRAVGQIQKNEKKGLVTARK